MMRRGYTKVTCKHCDRLISGNMFNYHLRKCKPAIEFAKNKRLEELKQKPIEQLKLGEAHESGRIEELKRYIDSVSV